MKKAIKITQENIDNNKHLFKGKKVDDVDIITLSEFLKSIKILKQNNLFFDKL